jgi:hypothetical protein
MMMKDLAPDFRRLLTTKGGAMRLRTAFLSAVIVQCLVGCATTLSERASRVEIISAEEAKQHKFVARLTSSSSLTGVMRHTGYQNALNDVLDQAAAKGANFIVLDPDSGPSYWTTSEVVQAQAYK